jgi:hypothetical protein
MKWWLIRSLGNRFRFELEFSLRLPVLLPSLTVLFKSLEKIQARKHLILALHFQVIFFTGMAVADG